MSTADTKATIVPERPCPVCTAKAARFLFQQTFSTFSEGGLLSGFDLVVCAECGMAYADKIPPREVFDVYYARMSKYEGAVRSGDLSPTEKERFAETASLMEPHLKPDFRVVDIGCATGGLLAELQRRGFKRLVGLDPSPACCEAAKRLHGLDARTATIHELSAMREQFDVAVLTGVFEHLPELDESISSISKILKTGGLLYIEVPDASSYDKWFSAPYQFLSIEHVNYFSPASLRNLMAKRGFDCVFTKRVERHLGSRSIEPALAGLFSLTGKPGVIQPDTETEPALKRYLDISRQLETEIQQKISGLAESKTPLAIWGAGTHTQRLFATSKLKQANVVAVIDSNARYRGKKLEGVSIVTPNEFSNKSATVVISSEVYEPEIKAQIQEQLRWTNPVVCFYEGRNRQRGA